ncbi:MAG: helix-turn-helix domain-containing protein [Acidobacteriota bacterium]
MASRVLLTTWQAARYCNVSPYTVRNWIRTGELEAFKTPGGHHRIRRRDLDSFLEAHAMPVPEAFVIGSKRVLFLVSEGSLPVVQETALWSPDLEVEVAPSAFEGGLALLTFRPHVIAMDLSDARWGGMETLRRLARTPETAQVRLAAFVQGQDVDTLESLESLGISAVFTHPVDPGLFRRYLRRLFPYARWTALRPRARES